MDLLEKILSPHRDYVPRSSPGVLEDFLKTSIYADFLGELNIRIEDMRDSLELGNKEIYLETRGALAAMRVVSALFTDLLNNAGNALDNDGEDDGNRTEY